MLRPLAMLVLLLAPSSAHAQVREELPRGAYPVIGRDGRPSLIVLRATTEPGWGRGGLRLLRREEPVEVSRSVSLAALPRQVRRDARGTVRLYSGGREICRARIGRPRLYRRVTPFDYDEWNGTQGRRWTDREVARAAWDLAEGHEILGAPLIPMGRHCSSAQWASPSPVVFGTEPTVVDPELIGAFRELDAYAEMTEEWTDARSYDDDPGAEHWDARSNGESRWIYELTTPGGRFTLIAAEGHNGCGDFVGVLWALLRHGPDGLELLMQGRTSVAPDGLADLDHDGTPELLGFQRVWSVHRDAPVDVSAPFHGCPC